MESLSDKLKSLGVKIGTDGLTSKPQETKSTGYPIESVLPGIEIETAAGHCFSVQADYPYSHSQGIQQLIPPQSAEILHKWANIPSEDNVTSRDLLFLDTETSGLSGGTGTFAFLIGFGFFTDHGFHLVQLFMRDPSQELALLAALNKFIYSHHTVVTFNGKSFDIPLLNGRHVINFIESPFIHMAHIDLLPMARRLWKNRLPSRALKDLEVDILQMARSEEEVPGWMIPELYFDYLRSGDARPLAGVFYHNANDIVSLAALYGQVAELLEHPLNHPETAGLDLIAIARLYEELQRIEEAVAIYETGINIGLPDEFLGASLMRFSMVYRRKGMLEESIRLWERAANKKEVDACIELAKHYEHSTRDYQQAVKWTLYALEIIQESNRGNWQKKQLSKELTRRLERLESKIGRTYSNAGK